MCGCSPPSLLNLLEANKDSKKNEKWREVRGPAGRIRREQDSSQTLTLEAGNPDETSSQDEQREEENEFVLKKGSGGSGSEEEQELPQIHKYKTETEI